MGKLEKKVNEVSVEKELISGKVYPGLVLLEDSNYRGGTSIRYWM